MGQSQIYNFSAGPATLPTEVLTKVQRELLDYQGSGLPVMTFSHRSELFMKILQQTEQDLRSLLAIPDKYSILFLQGGASQQFSEIIWNLSQTQKKRVGCVVSGNWSKIAYQQMKKNTAVETLLVASSEQQGKFLDIPEQSSWQVKEELDFIHFTSNETVHGVQFPVLPVAYQDNQPFLVCDMSSDFLSRKVQVKDYGLIYAGAQKNVGPAGVTIVLVRNDLLDRAAENLPDVFNYQSHVKKNGMYNTPNTFGVYVCGLVMEWLLAHGGIESMEKINKQKADLLYQSIAQSDGFYQNHISHRARSQMNVVFYTGNQQLDSQFIQEANEAGLKFLKGYHSLGGMRASIYNAMPLAGVEKLCQFMQDFQKKHG